MSEYIWSLSQLEELVGHSEPSVQEWALSTLFSLYPESAQARFPQFLKDPRETVVAAALAHLGAKKSEDLVLLLRDIYLHGLPDLSAEAVRVLGDWQVNEAVEWMKQRILQGDGLQAKQIANMIYALGQIPTSEARDLLKSTEASVNKGGIRHWSNFYGALLNHRQAEDVDAVLAALADPSQKDRHLEAFGVLLSITAPSLNPTEVFYGSFSAVEKHILARLEQAGAKPTPAQPADLAADLPKDWNALTSEARQTALALLQKRLDSLAETPASSFEYQIARKVAMALREAEGPSDTGPALFALAWCALVAALVARKDTEPKAGGDWREKLRYLLQGEPPHPGDDAHAAAVIQSADRSALIQKLRSVLRDEPQSWRAVRAMLMLGELTAVEALPDLIQCIAHTRDRYGHEALQRAMLNLGTPTVPALIPLLGSSDRTERNMAWTILSELPTEEGVKAQLAHLPEFYLEDPQRALAMVQRTGTAEFLPFVDNEYRPGELALASAYVHLCQVNRIQDDRLAEIQRDSKRLRERQGRPSEWPDVVPLELGCTKCGKRYHYDVKEVHLHPPDAAESEAGADDLTPFQHGIVIRDDIRCKNCGTTNAVRLTPQSRDRLTAEFVRMLAHVRAGKRVPSSFPIALTNWPTGGEKPVTLREIHRDHLKAAEDHPSKPAAHLALGKFYEYVKQDAEARRAYLQALDLDNRCLEALAGLARTDYAAGRLKEAVDWIESCHEQLETGHFFLVEDRAAFKKATRDARHQYARELGIKPKEATVDIRFRVEASDHPKNKPCPCGSGMKYKACCMPGKKS